MREAWAKSVAAGVPDELYWRVTRAELVPLLEAYSEAREAQARADALNAGLIAATILNVNRSKSTQRLWQPGDFMKQDQESKTMTPEQVREHFRRVGGKSFVDRRHEA